METAAQPILESRQARSSMIVRDTESMPWQTDCYGRRAKVLFRDEATSGQLLLLSTQVDSVGGPLRYHTFHEWAYRLSGDVFYNESPTVPLSGPLVQYREGHFLNRYRHSLHGGETPAEFGGVVLVMEEGHLTNETFLAGAPDFAEKCVHNGVKQWTSPACLDTMSDLSWQTSIGHTGVRFKHLAEDTQNGFRATLWLLSAGWRGAGNSFAEPYYFEHAHQFNFVLKGDLKVTSYETSTAIPARLTLRRHAYFERPPGSIAGLAEEEATTQGCIWLEVTYARSARVGTDVIEARKYPCRSAGEADQGGSL
jgi:hypothetical protein